MSILLSTYDEVNCLSDNPENNPENNSGSFSLTALASAVGIAVPSKKESHVYTPSHPGASIPMAATIKKLCQRVCDQFMIKKANSFMYSIRGIVVKSGRNRYRRLSRRISLCRLQQILLCAYDIATGELYDNILETSLALYAGISLRTLSRLIKLFKKMGWIEIRQRSKEGVNGLYALPAKKYLTPAYFIQVLGQDAWDMVCQYRRTHTEKHGEQKSADAHKKRLAARSTHYQKLDWKEEARSKYETKGVFNPEELQKAVHNLARIKSSTPYGSVSVADYQKPIYQENYYDSYKEDPKEAAKEIYKRDYHQKLEYNRSLYQDDSRTYNRELDREQSLRKNDESYQIATHNQPVIPQRPPEPTHACHRDFVAPVVTESLEVRRAAAQNAMAQMRAKLGMKKKDPP